MAGRKTQYRKTMDIQVGKLTALGATDEEVADFLEVSITTLKNWKNKHPSFLAALNEGKDRKDDEVEASLLQRALGYSHDEDKIFCNKDGEVTVVPTTKHYPPDTTAMIFWLKNRRREQWRDVQRHEHEHKVVDELAERLMEARKNAETSRKTLN